MDIENAVCAQGMYLSILSFGLIDPPELYREKGLKYKWLPNKLVIRLEQSYL